MPHRKGGQKSDGIDASARATARAAMIGKLIKNTSRAAASARNRGID